jgi:prepilin-type N-terminal cleavage/methylation domain-containing protein
VGQQKPYRKLNHGFTLIELLIATSILLLMMSLAMLSYQLFQRSWQQELSSIRTHYQTFRTNDLVSEALHGVIPYLVRSEDQYGFYFLGKEEGFTAVTDSAVFAAGELAVFRLFRERQNDGRFQLVYEEALLKGIQLVDASQNLPFQHRMVVSRDQKFINFSYYTQPGLADGVRVDEMTGDVSIVLKWLQQHDGIQSKTHPQLVKIDLSGFAWQVQVPSRSTTLRNRLNAETEAH